MSNLPSPLLAALRALAVLFALGVLALVVGNACARQNAYLPETKAAPVFEPAVAPAPPDLAHAPVFFPATKAAPVWNPPPPQVMPQQQAPAQKK